MAARVIHIGKDNCHRLPVLESAGYQVDDCNSVGELRQALADFEPFEAVLVTENDGVTHEDLIHELRERSNAPVVLFRETLQGQAESAFDMEVPVLQSPETWLADLAELIARSLIIRMQSKQICNKSLELREQVAKVIEKSWRERRRSREVAKKIPPPEGFVRGPEKD